MRWLQESVRGLHLDAVEAGMCTLWIYFEVLAGDSWFPLVELLGQDDLYIRHVQMVIIIGLPKTSSSYVHMVRQRKGRAQTCSAVAQTVTKLDRQAEPWTRVADAACRPWVRDLELITRRLPQVPSPVSAAGTYGVRDVLWLGVARLELDCPQPGAGARSPHAMPLRGSMELLWLRRLLQG